MRRMRWPGSCTRCKENWYAQRKLYEMENGVTLPRILVEEESPSTPKQVGVYSLFANTIPLERLNSCCVWRAKSDALRQGVMRPRLLMACAAMKESREKAIAYLIADLMTSSEPPDERTKKLHRIRIRILQHPINQKQG